MSADLHLGALYLALLRRPHDSWRDQHQWLYANYRDRIAIVLDLEAKQVQDMFEWLAANERTELSSSSV